MKEKNKKFNVDLHINLKTYSNDFKDLFLVSSTKELSSKKYVFSQQMKELFIISYTDREFAEIIISQKLKEILKNNPSIKIISYIKYNEDNNSFIFCNSFKYQKKKNLYKPENCGRLWKLFHQNDLNLILQNDIIKLGYISLKFDKIFFSSNKKDNNNSNINIIQEKNSSFSCSDNENEKFCRICFQKGFGPVQGNGNGDLDPLISVCKCSESMKYTHLSCLKNKINSNIYKNHYKYYDIYLFKNYNCEICLETFPKYIMIDNKKINLLDLDTSNYENYAICDMIKFDEKNKYNYRIGFLVIHFDEESVVKIGRKKENDIIFNDLSISGFHCELIGKNGNLFLKDVGSSYGCLKYIQNELEINEENEVIKSIFISGNNKFEVNLVKNEALFNFDCFGFLKNLIFENKCCSSSVNNKGDIDFLNDVKEEEENNRNLEENKTGNSRAKYFEKFEDCDSYNDYMINIDNEKFL